MPMMRAMLCALALFVSTTAFAHTGVPGHVHPEMTFAQQLVHAAMNWAPLLVIVGFAGQGVRKALRVKGSQS